MCWTTARDGRTPAKGEEHACGKLMRRRFTMCRYEQRSITSITKSWRGNQACPRSRR